MQFLLKRLMQTIKSKKLLLLVIVVPVALYILISALIPHGYTVQKIMKIPGNTAVALPNNPTKYTNLDEAVHSKQKAVFYSNYALSSLLDVIYINTDLRLAKPELASLHKLVRDNVQFRTKGKQSLLISSSGSNLEVNKTFADFYLGYTLDLVRQGLIRAQESNIQDFRALKKDALQSSQITAHRSLFTSGRTPGLLIVFVVSLLIYCTVITLIELNDNTFKSERQAVQYLDMDLIGSIPNLKKIAQSWESFNRS